MLPIPDEWDRTCCACVEKKTKKKNDRGKETDDLTYVLSRTLACYLQSATGSLNTPGPDAERQPAAASGSLVYTKPLCLGSNLQNKRGVCV